MPKRKIIPYNPKLKALAKELRQNMTLPEVLVWRELKGNQILGYDFDRQRPIDEYIVDFYCKDLSLAIEIDGSDHDAVQDSIRQHRLESLGVRFLRFSNDDILKNMPFVLNEIYQWIEEYQDS